MSLLSNLASPPLRGTNVQMRLIKFERLFIFFFLVLNLCKVSSGLLVAAGKCEILFRLLFFLSPPPSWVRDSCHWLSGHS